MTEKTTSSGRNQPVWQFWRGPGCGASGLPSAIEGVSPARVLETSSEALGGITKPVDCCQEAGVLPSNRGRRGPVGSVVGDRPKPCGSTWSCSRDPAQTVESLLVFHVKRLYAHACSAAGVRPMLRPPSALVRAYGAGSRWHSVWFAQSASSVSHEMLVRVGRGRGNAVR